MMKFLVAFFVIFFSFQSHAKEWVEADKFYIGKGNAKSPIAIFVSTESPTAIPAGANTPNQWHDVDVTEYGLPEDVTGVFLSGILVLTHPNVPAMCHIWANFRAKDDTLSAGNFQMQALEPTTGGGSRTNAAVWVPVKDGVFQFYWHYNPQCASAINLSLQAYVK